MMKTSRLLIRFQSLKSKEVRFLKLNFRSNRYIQHESFFGSKLNALMHMYLKVLLLLLLFTM